VTENNLIMRMMLTQTNASNKC